MACAGGKGGGEAKQITAILFSIEFALTHGHARFFQLP